MPDTRGRDTGEGGSYVPVVYRMVRQPWEDEPHLWRAVCIERCMHGSGKGSWKRDLMVHVRGARWLSILPGWSLVRIQLGPPLSLQTYPLGDLRQAIANNVTRKSVKIGAYLLPSVT